MKVVVQRSLQAKCYVNQKIVGESNKGLLLLVSFTEGDSWEQIQYLVQKIVHLRIFDDENGVMNKSILEIEGASILSISQFTLYANTKKGNRPSYYKALNGKEAKELYDLFNHELAKFVDVETGVFGSYMQLDFINDGPVTILLER
ncbi:MAG: D-aminoacyl-tRNA deacylase [bacterium]|nr:D-aminoacyl-tRNA deacylase [bacterium]